MPRAYVGFVDEVSLNFLIVDASGPALQTLRRLGEGGPMEARVRQTGKFGDLVVTAFDSAAQCSTDPAEVSRLARQMVMHVLRHMRGAPLRRRPTGRTWAAGTSQR